MVFLFAIAGTASGALGLYCLRDAWLSKAKTPLKIFAGWGLLLTAVILWAFYGGPDRGAAWGMMVVSLMALVFVGYSALKDTAHPTRKTKQKLRQSRKPEPISLPVYVGRLGTFLLACPLAGVIAFLGALGVYEALTFAGLHPSNTFVTALFVFPIAWAGVATFILICKDPLLKTGVILAVALASTALLISGN